MGISRERNSTNIVLILNHKYISIIYLRSIVYRKPVRIRSLRASEKIDYVRILGCLRAICGPLPLIINQHCKQFH